MRDQCSNEAGSNLSGEGGRRAPFNGAVASPPSVLHRSEGNLIAATFEAVTDNSRTQPAGDAVTAISLICKNCGGEFIARRRDAKFCSASCKQTSFRNRQKPDIQQGEAAMSNKPNADPVATDQSLLHLAPEPEVVEKPATPGQTAANVFEKGMEVGRLLAGVQNQRDDSTEAFEWTSENLDVVVPQQGAIAVYSNPMGVVVIRQEKDWNDEGDHFVFVHPTHIDALVERLMVYKAQAELTIEERRLADLRERGLAQ